MNDLSQLYQSDYTQWARRMADLLRAGDFAALDIPHLLEELDDVGHGEQRELEDRLTVLLAHLLKWEYQYQALSERWREFKGDSWRATIVEQRDRIAKRLRKTPSLKALLDETILEAYADAIDLASKESRLPPETFPAACPYSESQILDDDYYPEPRASAG